MPRTVRIHGVSPISVPGGATGVHQLLAISYSVDGGLPRAVVIDADNNTPEERRRVIAEDIERTKSEAPESFELE